MKPPAQSHSVSSLTSFPKSASCWNWPCTGWIWGPAGVVVELNQLIVAGVKQNQSKAAYGAIRMRSDL